MKFNFFRFLKLLVPALVLLVIIVIVFPYAKGYFSLSKQQRSDIFQMSAGVKDALWTIKNADSYSDANDTFTESILHNIIGSATEQYYVKHTSYTGFCNQLKSNNIPSIPVDAVKGVTCLDSVQTIAVSSRLNSGKYYCVNEKQESSELTSNIQESVCK